MVEYVKRQVTLSKAQVEKLAKGKKVRLTNAALKGGNHTVFITHQQDRKIQTRLKKGVGMDIAFDSSQFKHNAQHGSGFFDSFKAAAKGALKDLAKEGLKIAVDKGGDFLKNKATEMIESKLGNQPAAAGSGVKRRSYLTKKQMDMIRAQHGEGFFDDVLGGLKSVAKVALPIAGNMLLARGGMPPMFGSGKRRGGKRGGAIGIYRRTARGGSFRLP